MSGSGGGGYGGPTRSSTDCNIVERVPLNSPQASVVSTLKPGDRLDVELRESVLVAVYKGTVAGALTPQSLLDLIDCIGKGRHYVANVLQLRGAFCEVEIRPR
jgi:hypothetical protein